MIQDIKFILLLILLLVSTPFLGAYMANVFAEKFNFLYPIERFVYAIFKINSEEQMDWKRYLKCLLILTFLGIGFALLIELTQEFLPFNPQGFKAVPFWLALNTAISFATNTNWQSYAGETTMSYFTQMIALTSQNFISGTIGLCTLVALTRGIVGRGPHLGNFYKDFTKSILYIFLPLAIIFSIILVFEGVIQNLSPYLEVTTLEGTTQIIPMGPVASQEAIKQLGTNGGGFFNTNSAHPFENPSFLTDLLENLAILLIPASSVFMFGKMIRSKKQASILFFTMGILWLASLALSDFFQMVPNETLSVYPNLEGQELRFGPFRSVLWTVSTTATGSGSVNSMISSLSPLTSGMALLNMMLGEVIFGGIGVGLAGMLMFVLVTVFIAGLMIGRTPEYMGKKIDKNEMKWVMLAILGPCAMILIAAGICILLPQTLDTLGNPGPHGLTEVLYAMTSASANNGSAMSSLSTDNNLFNITLSILMLLARLIILISSLAIAGLLGPKKLVPLSVGTFKTDSYLFSCLLTSIILIFAGLTFFPALTLGPIIEQLLSWESRTLS